MILMLLTIGLNFVMTLNLRHLRSGSVSTDARAIVWDRQSATLKVNMPAEYENAIVYVPEDALLGYNVGSNGFIYPLYRADFSQRIVYVPFEASDSCEMLCEAMELRGSRYLFVAPEHTPDAKIALLRRAVKRQDQVCASEREVCMSPTGPNRRAETALVLAACAAFSLVRQGPTALHTLFSLSTCQGDLPAVASVGGCSSS